MDTVFQNSYYKYFLWNDGLIEHYLSDHSGQEILLYVDEKTLEYIGQKSHISIEKDTYKDDFENSVIEFCKHYNLYLSSCKKPSQSSERLLKSPNQNVKKVYCKEKDCKFYVFNSYCLPWSDRLDILAIANHICTGGKKEVDVKADSEGDFKRNSEGQENSNANNGIPYFKKDAPNSICKGQNGKAIKQELPFFAIVVYLILKFDNGDTQQWDNVGGIRTSSREYVKDLWEAISSLYPSFKKDASAYVRIEGQNEDYVGRIKYHIMLSSSIRRKLNDAIYKTSIWKFSETMSFAEQKRRLLSSNTDIADYFSEKNIDNTVFDRKLQIVIEEFDLEDYLDKLSERRKTREFRQTKSAKEYFALAISYPEKNESGVPEIRMLTTVHQEIHDQNYHIQECQTGSLDGFNVHFVRYRDSYDVNIEEHYFENDDYNIRCLPINDWLFFYEYHETLFIQTNDIEKSNRYIILVRDLEQSKNNFQNWIATSGNYHLIHYPKEVTRDLFGNDWVVYFSNRRLNNNNDIEEIGVIQKDIYIPDTIIFGGGIKNKNNDYYLQALPYIEIPERFGDINKVDVRIKINDGYRDYVCSDYEKKIISGRRLVIDLKNIQNIADHMSCAITVIIANDEIDLPCIGLCTQDVNYNQGELYKYDLLGKIVNDSDNYAYSGNLFQMKSSIPIHGYYIISHLELIENVVESMYFINLLSACCYNSPTLEIPNSLFDKCLDYAITRMQITNQSPDFKSALRQQLSNAGYINTNFSTSKIQIIPPAFSKTPRTLDGNNRLIMLSGGYTKKFMVDLLHYCNERNIKVYQRPNNTSFKGLIPPTILLASRFDAYEFKKNYNHQCDVSNAMDSSLSLIYSSSDASSAFDVFCFNKTNNILALNLRNSLDNEYPRIRRDKNLHNIHYYIEERKNCIAPVDKALIPWAYWYCFVKRNNTIAICHENNIFIPIWYASNNICHKRLKLPTAIQRSLWMMNLGMPNIVKAFVCGSNDSSYYKEMYEYRLGGKNRVLTMRTKLCGYDESLYNKIRNRYQTSLKLKIWSAKPEFDITEKKYLVLYSENLEWIAIGFDSHVYIKWKELFYKVEGEMNEIFSFLIKERWQVEDGEILLFSNGRWSTYRKFTKDTISVPDHHNFIIEELTIL